MKSVALTLQVAQLSVLPTMLLGAAVVSHAEGKPGATLKPSDCRIREQGNLNDDGVFSFWDRGKLGDWFLREGNAPVTLSLTAWGKTIDGEAPTLGVDVVGVDGVPVEVGRIPVDSAQPGKHELALEVKGDFFGLQLRHTNRRIGTGEDKLRHLLVKEIRVRGARRSEAGLTEYAFFGGRPAQGESAQSPDAQTIETEKLRLVLDPKTASWSLEHKPSRCRLADAGPLVHLGGVEVDFAQYESKCQVQKGVTHKLGVVTHANLNYRKPGELTLDYDLLLSQSGDELIARLSFSNETGKELIVSRLAPVVSGAATLGGKAADLAIIGDAKSNAHPYETVRGGELKEFESWWYAAAKDLRTGRSLVLGSLTNNKGLGRFLVLPGDDKGIRVAAYSDYEGATMPPGARIEGEWMLVHFGKRGTDGLERFGDLIAAANDIDLRRNHPLDPYTPEGVDLFSTWNSYGSAVVKGFDYKHDRAKGKQAFMDPAWTKANRAKLVELGLQHFGYLRTGPVDIQGLATPLTRRYGQPDFWFKEAQQIHDEHPELYVDGRIDFSHPDAIAFERERVRKAFAGKTGIVRNAVDFTNRWEKLPGQHNPFMTSAETYRAAMGLWREAGRHRAKPHYCFMWMNVVGLNYDMVQVIHIGHDSDQGYGGPGLTFTHGLTRQISGRYFLNGRVWWNSPDSYHVYCGGIYSHNQGKTHASYCALSGNLVHLGEPLCDEELPEDRLDMIRRVSPTTADVARAVDVFEHNPARLWDMHVQRPFGDWHVVGLFNVDYDGKGTPITQEIRFEDLDLSPDGEYLVYEFWTRQFLGAQTRSFTRTLQAPDCEVYSIVEKKPHPVLVSTSRHVRQMAYDVLDLKWDEATNTLRGKSKLTQDDPYELRVYMPGAYTLAEAKAGELEVNTNKDGQILTVAFTSPESGDVEWSVRFARHP